jgi:hypothetical protein
MIQLYSLLPDLGTATVDPGGVEKGICHRKVESGKMKHSQTMLTGWRLSTGLERSAQDLQEVGR